MRRSSKVIQAEIDEQLIEAEAILDKAESEGRELTPWELTKFDALAGDEGTIPELQTEFEAVKATEDRKGRLALQQVHSMTAQERNSMRTGDYHVNIANTAPRVQHRIAPLKAFANNAEGARQAYGSGHWLRAIIARKRGERDERSEEIATAMGFPIQMAQTEGVGTAGGYLVPDVTSATIIDVRALVGVARRLATVVPLTSDNQKVPKVTAGLTVYAPGEGNTVTASDLSLGQVNLIAVKRAVASQISNELNDDALVSMSDLVFSQMGHALALQEDKEYVNGDSTSTYFGEVGLLSLLGSAGIHTPTNGTGESVWSGLSNASVSALKGKLPSKFHQKDQMAYVCSSEFYYSVFDRLMNAAGGNSNNSLRTGGLFDVADLQYNGVPVFLTDQMPRATSVSTVSCLYGNFGASSMLGDRSGVRLAMSAEYAFLDDVLTLLGVSRYDINVYEGGDSSNAGGYVGLKTAAS